MNVRVVAWRRLSAKELMLLNCSARENSWVPWIAMRSDKSILKKSNPEYSLEGLMLKLQHLGYLMLRANSLEKTLKGVTKDEIVGWVSLTQWTRAWANSRKQWRMGKSSMLPPMGLQREGFNIVTEQASWLYNCLHVELKPMISSLLSCTLLVFISPNVRSFFHLNDPIGSSILPI